MFKVMQLITTNWGKTPYEINNGDCYDWAEKVFRAFKGSIETWETPYDISEVLHGFVKVANKFYDAECLNGVKDHMDLPIFKKWAGSGLCRHPVWRIGYKGKCFGPSRRSMTLLQVKEYNKINGIE